MGILGLVIQGCEGPVVQGELRSRVLLHSIKPRVTNYVSSRHKLGSEGRSYAKCSYHQTEK